MLWIVGAREIGISLLSANDPNSHGWFAIVDGWVYPKICRTKNKMFYLVYPEFIFRVLVILDLERRQTYMGDTYLSNTSIRISVVTAAYNAEQYIAHMIQSVVEQPAVLELIIVNDGSKDKTQEICERYASEYKDIIVVNCENQGAGAARNKGIDVATGDYVIFLDSDDLIAKDVINKEFLAYVSECNDKKVDIIYTGRTMVDMELLQNPIFTPPEPVKYHLPELEFWTCIFRRDFLVQNNIRFYTYKEQDIESAFRYLSFANAKRIERNPQFTYYIHRINVNSNMHTCNYLTVGYVKAEVYYDLLVKRNLVEEGTEEAFYLRMIILDSIYNFVQAFIVTKNKEQITVRHREELRSVFNEIKKDLFFGIACLGLRNVLRCIKKCILIDANYRYDVNWGRRIKSSNTHREENCYISDYEFKERWERVSLAVKTLVRPLS